MHPVYRFVEHSQAFAHVRQLYFVVSERIFWGSCRLFLSKLRVFVYVCVLHRSQRFLFFVFPFLFCIVNASDAVREAVEKALSEEAGRLVDFLNHHVVALCGCSAPSSKVRILSSVLQQVTTTKGIPLLRDVANNDDSETI